MCSGILTPDIMHDILEGILQYEVKLVLQHCVEQKFVKVKAIEKLMEKFEFSYGKVRNRPTPIDNKVLRNHDNSLRQNGMLKQFILAFTCTGILIIIPFSFSDVAFRSPSSVYDWSSHT